MAEQRVAQSGSRSVQCVVVTPERAVLDVQTDFVALPMFDGELGVAPGRTPLIGRLGIGELRIGHPPHAQRLFIDGGFVQVRANVVTVLTPAAQTADEIKPDAVRAAVDAAKSQKATTPEQQVERERSQQRARVKLRVAEQKSPRSGGH